MENAKIRWLNFKTDLAQTCDWLNAFQESAVTRAVALVNEAPRNHYEPLLLDTLLKEASQALDRCISFRREAYELEIAAVKAAAEYNLFLALAPGDEESEIIALHIESYKSKEIGYRKASAMYNIDKAFGQHDETLSDSAKVDLEGACTRQGHVKQRWEIRRKYEEDYHARHETPGNAHNFKERLARLIPLLADDLQESYEKLLASHIGIKTIYGDDVSLFPELDRFPKLDGEGTLDNMVVWARDAIRFLELQREQESTYDLVIPLTQKWGPSGRVILTSAELGEKITEGGDTKTITFDLSETFFNQKRVRLRGVGLAVGSRPVGSTVGDIDRLGYLRLRAVIHTPKQPQITEAGRFYNRPPIILGDVATYGRSMPVAMRSGPECHNVDPRGEWKIVLSKYGIGADEHTQTVEPEGEKKPVADLKLYLRIVGKPHPDAASVFAP